MNYILDTNICIYWLKGNRDIESKVLKIGFESVSISFVTLCELYFGAYKSQKIKDNISNIEKLKENLNVVESNSVVCETFGKLKASLVKEGRVIDDADILIAACALEEGAVLVTNNEKHFKSIKELELENWMSDE